MAILYVRSTDGNNADDGSTWALAKQTIAGALAAASAGDTIYVSHSHAFAAGGAAITLTSPGTAASPVNIICVNDGAEPPTTLATTATETNTGANAITFAGFAVYYGITFNCGTGASAASIGFTSGSAWWHKFINCALKLLNTGATARISVGSTSSTVEGELELIGTPLTFSATGQGILVNNCEFYWSWTSSALAGTIPTALFVAATRASNVYLTGLDLSAAGAGKSIITASSPTNTYFQIKNCRLNASVGISTGSITSQAGVMIDMVNCDSGSTNYNYQKTRYQGDITDETTIVRTGGASDGTTAISRKMVSSANAKFYSPLEADPILIWNDGTSSITVSVYTVTDNVTLTDAECWIEVEELGTSGYPQSTLETDRAADILATPANQTTDSSTWTTTGLTTPVYQVLAKTFTPASKGPLLVRVMLAKASTTVYVCPEAGVA